MLVRKSNAAWDGTLKKGRGTVTLGSGTFTGNYSFASRFENGQRATNPEELVAAAHAASFRWPWPTRRGGGPSGDAGGHHRRRFVG